MNTFATRLKELRIERGLTQTALAIATNLSQTAIAKWENGTRSPSADMIVVIAKFFSVSSDYLLGLED